MSYADQVFVQNCRDILSRGVWDTDREVRPRWEDGSPAHTIKLFGVVNRYDLRREFPILTLRRQYLKSAVDELLWIWQKKSNNIRDLNSHVWDAWADESGSIGKAYGYQLCHSVVLVIDAPLRAIGVQTVVGRKVAEEAIGIDVALGPIGSLAAAQSQIITLYALVHHRPEVACTACLALPAVEYHLRVDALLACHASGPEGRVKPRKALLDQRGDRFHLTLSKTVGVALGFKAQIRVTLVGVDLIAVHRKL